MTKFLVTALAVAVASVAQARKLQNIAVVEGTCGKFLLLGVDATEYCQGKVSNAVYDDGRSSFTYVAERPGQKPLVLTFSGNGRAQIKQNDDEVVQPVDRLITNMDGRIYDDRATGSCRFRNPYRPAAIFNCSADTKDGHYEVSFGSSGRPPSLMRP